MGLMDKVGKNNKVNQALENKTEVIIQAFNKNAKALDTIQDNQLIFENHLEQIEKDVKEIKIKLDKIKE